MGETVRYTIKHEITNIGLFDGIVVSKIWNIRLYINNAMYVSVTERNVGFAFHDGIDIRFTIFSNDTMIINRAINNYKGESIKLIKRNKLEDYSRPIILMIEIVADNKYVKILDETEKTEVNLNDFQLCRLREFDDLEKILNNQMFSDVTINVGDKTFYAHKIILLSKSPVFAAMFNHDMRENKENIINIDDMHPVVFMEMLRFMYVAKIQNLKELADDLLPAADKYCLERLKSICEKCMSEKLSIDNVFHYIKLAILYNAANLKREAVEFIKSNRLKLNKLDENELKENFKNIDANVVYEIVRALTST